MAVYDTFMTVDNSWQQFFPHSDKFAKANSLKKNDLDQTLEYEVRWMTFSLKVFYSFLEKVGIFIIVDKDHTKDRN